MRVIATQEGQKQTLICQFCQTEDVRFPTIKSRGVPMERDGKRAERGRPMHEAAMMVVLFLCHNGDHLSQYSLIDATVAVEVTPVEKIPRER